MTDGGQAMTFEEAVRKRPFMYIGNNGIIGLFTGLVLDCIALCKTDQILFSISLIASNKFSIGIATTKDTSPFINRLSTETKEFHSFHPNILKVVASKLEIVPNAAATYHDKIETRLDFEFDQTVFKDTIIDYQKLSEELFQLALLNRATEIIVRDARQKYLSQNYYHFPGGIFYLFDRFKKEALGKPEFEITFDGQLKANRYQIGIAYRTDWYPSPSISSFANDINTIDGGSLVTGVYEGLIAGCEKYVKKNNLSVYNIREKKFVNGLILVCSVRGEKFEYGGSFKESLIDKDVEELAKKEVAKIVADYLQNNKEKAEKFLWRFNDQELGSAMF